MSSPSSRVRRCRHVRSRTRRDPRRRARESALQILYQWEVGRREVDGAADTFFDQQWPDAEPPSDEGRRFASTLARGTVRQLETIDRLILRMAICELMRGGETAGNAPPAVVINEALELARTFSSEESVKFINGMLDAIRKKLK